MLHCSSPFLVYCLRCCKCSILYIGETCCHTKSRIDKHLVRNNIYLKEPHVHDADINISKLFSSSNHSIFDMSVLGLLYAPKSSRKRKTLEKESWTNSELLGPPVLINIFYFLIYLYYYFLSTFLL